MNVHEKDLQLIKELIFECGDNCREVCGNLLMLKELPSNIDEKTKANILKKYNNNPLILYLETFGEKSSCINKTYTTYSWHIHSKASKGYPSKEDIISVLKNRPLMEIIFTIWGIWEIKSSQKYNIRKNDTYLPSLIDRFLHTIYRETNGARDPILEGQQLHNVLHQTNLLKESLQKKFPTFQIHFTPWQKISGHFILNLTE